MALAIGLVGSIAEAIMTGPEGESSAYMSIAGLNPETPSAFLPGMEERKFQYWPESISDTIDIGWNFKDIPGASHALAQWASNNGRTITFEIQLHRFMKPRKNLSVMEIVKTMGTAMLTTPTSTIPMNQTQYNVDVANEIRFLRGFCYPYFMLVEGIQVSLPPPVAMLSIPGLPLDDESGGPVIYAVMTGCDVTYNLLFPDGTPRRATVSLTFRQIVQRSKVGVFFRGHAKDTALQHYTLAADPLSEKIAPNKGSNIKIE